MLHKSLLGSPSCTRYFKDRLCYDWRRVFWVDGPGMKDNEKPYEFYTDFIPLFVEY